jgi:hypothetical protein
LFKGTIVKTRNNVRTSRPLKGLVAFARAAAMGSFGAGGATVHPAYPTTQPCALAQLDRGEDRMHPGEGSA